MVAATIGAAATDARVGRVADRTSIELDVERSGPFPFRVKIVIGLIPVFGIAAFFEGFITGLYKMPFILNIFLLSLSAAFIIWYFIIYPVRLKNRFAKESVADA